MRIMLVTNNYTPYSGGVVSSVQATVQTLLAHGHEPLIVTLAFDQHTPDPAHVRRIFCPIQFDYYTNPLAVPWRPYHELLCLMRTFKPDLVHSQHPFLLGMAALRAARRLHVPVVFTYHTQYELYAHYVPLPQQLIRPIIRRLVSRYCTQVQHIIAPSTGVQELLAAQQISTPTTVMPSALKEPFVPRKPFVLKKRTQTFRLLCVSRFVPEKNISCLFEVLRLLDDLPVCLNLVGYGMLYEQLQAEAYTRFGFSHARVHFVHKPARQELKKQYQEADLFLFPSHSDTQGLVLAEALSCGTPVVALEGIGQRDCIQEGRNGYLVTSAEHMSTTIRQVYHNQKLHEALQKNAWESAQKYAPEAVFDQLMGIYQNVLKAHQVL